jgi:hypothetical protein
VNSLKILCIGKNRTHKQATQDNILVIIQNLR